MEHFSGEATNPTTHQTSPSSFMNEDRQSFDEKNKRVLSVYPKSSLDLPAAIMLSLKQPCAIIDEDFNILDRNEAFQNFLKQQAGATSINSFYDLVDAVTSKDLQRWLSQLTHITIDKRKILLSRRSGKQVMVSAYKFRRSNDLVFISLESDSNNEQNNNLKNDFFNMASHELKTPVMSINAYAEMLHEILLEKNDQSSAVMVSKMQEQVNRLSSLISHLLNGQRLYEGEVEFNFETLDFNALVKQIINDAQRNLKRRIVTLSLCEEQILVRADKQRLGQAIENLFSNAFKYSSEETEVIVQTVCQNGEVTFSVKDFGIGISTTDHHKVFERFFKTSDTADTYPGIGLGLYIAAEIIRRHNGFIDVQSAPGVGSTFYFNLPLLV